MNLKYPLTVLISTAFSSFAQAQRPVLSGRLTDPETRKALPGATVRLSALRDTSYRFSTLTDAEGRFRFEGLRPDSLRLSFSSVGYENLSRSLRLTAAGADLGDLPLPRSARELSGVVVRGSTPPAVQKGDTVQFNASSYKTTPDANAEDLVRKMPGITLENGQVRANGETVQRVTIDGRELFGDDATAALRNLPAEVIDKIQVFDRLSDQAQLTGVDDGNTQRAINIVTRANMRNGQFGRVFAGAGADDQARNLRYNAGGNSTFLKNNRRISLVANFNNINQQNFSQQDLLGVTSNARSGGNRGGGGRGGFGGGGRGNFGGNTNNFTVGQQPGITRTSAFGINYTDQWGKKVTATASYFFNDARNESFETANTEFFSKANAFSRTADTTSATSHNSNHRFNARIEWRIDSLNQLLIIPNLSLQNNRTERLTDRSFAFNENPGGLDQRSARNSTDSRRNGFNGSNSIIWRRSFRTRGRSFTASLNTSANRRVGDTYVGTFERLFLLSGGFSDTATRRFTDQENDGWSAGLNLTYTEPIGKKGQLQASYNPTINRSDANQLAWGYVENEGKYNRFLDSLSNQFRNRTNTQNGGLTWRLGDRDKMLAIGLSYQYTHLQSDQSFPRSLQVNSSFNNLLPNAMLRYKLSNRSNVRLFYRAQVNTPNVTQLQGVVDPNNAPLYTMGNPELKPQYLHTLSGQYTFTNTPKGQLLVGNLFVQAGRNFIANGTFTPRTDTVVSGVGILAGSQLTKPVNLDGYRSLRSLLNYAFPVKALKSNLTFNTGFTYSQLPGLVNDTRTEARNYVYTAGTVLASNISQYVDLTVSYSANFNQVRNSGGSGRNNSQNQNFDFYQHAASVQLNLLSKKGWLFNTDANNTYFSGYTAAPSQIFTLWNMAVGRKFGKNRQSDLRVSVFDLLGQNQSIQRTVSDLGIENQNVQVLQRYYLLTFTHNLRNFGRARR